MFYIYFFIISLLSGYNITDLNIYFDKIIVSTANNGLYSIDTVDFLLSKIPSDKLPCECITTTEVINNKLWVGTYNGLVVFDENNNILLKYIPQSYYDRWIRDIVYYNNKVYLATLTGLLIYKDKNFYFDRSIDGVSCFLDDNVLYIGTEKGLYYLNENNIITPTHLSVNFLNQNYFPITSLEKQNNWLWVGLTDFKEGYSMGGLWLYDLDKYYIQINSSSGLIYDGISYISYYKEKLLISSYREVLGIKIGGGLQIFDNGNFTSYLLIDKLFPKINCILTFPENNQIWIGTTDGIEIVNDFEEENHR